MNSTVRSSRKGEAIMRAAILKTGKAFQMGTKAPQGEDDPLLIDESPDDVLLEDESDEDDPEDTKTKLAIGGFIDTNGTGKMVVVSVISGSVDESDWRKGGVVVGNVIVCVVVST
jgi:hypothetical protein